MWQNFKKENSNCRERKNSLALIVIKLVYQNCEKLKNPNFYKAQKLKLEENLKTKKKSGKKQTF